MSHKCKHGVWNGSECRCHQCGQAKKDVILSEIDNLMTIKLNGLLGTETAQTVLKDDVLLILNRWL